MNVPELEVDGIGWVRAIEDCPEIAAGEGSVVTGRFVTDQANDLVRVTVARLDDWLLQQLKTDGREALGFTLDELNELARLGLVELDTLEGTNRHPVWSEDRQEWVPLGRLLAGETLRAADGPAVVVSIAILNHLVPVYNIEVHGQHVYQVGQLGVLVHNANECFRVMDAAEFAGAKLGKWADGADDFKGFKWVWGSSEEAANWLSFLRKNGEMGGFLTRIDTLQDISKYKAFDHFPEGIARLVPFEELGKAVRF